ncbi:hypothetical protein Q1695_004026 [Nippostrongylus brasiliensis]|nr:hypothetical protein Q1695_004026 [Nippostrongylus brasiliensis]
MSVGTPAVSNSMKEVKVEPDDKLQQLMSRRGETEEVLNLLEEQLYSFEGDLLGNAFYGSVLHGWNRDSLSLVPSRVPAPSLKRQFHEDERIISRSSVEFMKRVRREAIEQESRSHGAFARRFNATAANVDAHGDTTIRRTLFFDERCVKTEPKSPTPQERKNKAK